MKKIFIITAILFFTKPSFCQKPDSAMVPYILLTKSEIRKKTFLERMVNYDAAIGQPFGSFSATSIDGQNISSQDLKGKVTFINFWFDACPPCHLQFDNLNSIYTRYKSDSNFQVISFTFDGIGAAKANANKYGLLYKIVSTSSESCHQLNFQHGFPANLILDHFGKVSFGYAGFGKDEGGVFAKTIIPKIDALLLKLKNR